MPKIKISKIELNHKIFLPLLSIIISIVLLLLMAFWIVPNSINAKKEGEKIGTAVGMATGKVIGSFNGLTEGIKQGYIDGKTAGLNSKDTEIEIANAIQDTGNLQVLTANATFKDFHQIGKGIAYAALYEFKGKVVFSVDLTKATISTSTDDVIIITLPVPEAKISIDENSFKRLAEKQKKYFNGSSEDGFKAAQNMYSIIEEESKEKIENYSFLEQTAKDSAKSHVETLAKNICENKRNIIVSFKEEL